MKKQALYIIPAILAAGAVSAQGFDGFYVGAGIGDSVTVGSSKASGTSTLTAPAGISSSSNSRAAFKKENFAGSLFAGYGWGYDCWYLGGEIYVKGFGKHSGRNNFSTRDTDPADTDISNLNVHAKLRSAEWGIDFRPGFLIGECTMLYGRVGAAFNRLNIDFNRSVISFPAGGGAATVIANDSVSNKKNRASLRLGAGLEHRFCDCWSVRVDWVYTSFRKHNQTLTSTRVVPGVGTITNAATANTKLHNHTTMFGLSYYW